MKGISKAVLISALLIFLLILSAKSASKPTEPVSDPATTAVSEIAEVPEPAVPSYVRREYKPEAFCEQIETETIIYYDVPLSNEMQDYIRDTLEEFDVDIPNGFEVILAMAYTESRFKSDVENGTCEGIMQVSEIHKESLEELGISDLLDPYDCFKAGIYLMKCSLDNADSILEDTGTLGLDQEEFRLNCALMSYNLGNYGAEKKIKSGVYSTSYVDKVREAMANLEVKNE